MYTVSQRTKKAKQPRGGYLPPKQFEQFQYSDGISLKDIENVPSGIISLAVNYLTRFLTGDSLHDAFYSPIVSALYLGQILDAETALKKIKGLDDVSICASCQLCAYDLTYRTGHRKIPASYLAFPNEDTLYNIRSMVLRGIAFFNENGPIKQYGYTLEGGYTHMIHDGQGDLMTDDTIWDFKIINTEITSKHTLRLLVYYLMGMHSGKKTFEHIRYLGIYNPRKNKSYILDLENIPDQIKKSIEKEVICYPN